MTAAPAPNDAYATARRPATYADLESAPDDRVAELIGGELVLSPRPTGRHARTSSVAGIVVGSAFGLRKGSTGPGGWLILDEPELHVAGILPDVYVPDLAGWRRERLDEVPDDHRFIIAPDWVCEVLSPRTAGRDLLQKGQGYLAAGVPWFWTIDPNERYLDVYRSNERGWEHIQRAEGDMVARLQPFDAVEIDLSEWWVQRAP